MRRNELVITFAAALGLNGFGLLVSAHRFAAQFERWLPPHSPITGVRLFQGAGVVVMAFAVVTGVVAFRRMRTDV